MKKAFDFKDLADAPFSLPSVITYKMSDGTEVLLGAFDTGVGTEEKQEWTTTVPVSFFVQPTAIPRDQFVALLRTAASHTNARHFPSTLENSIKVFETNFGVKTVEALSERASLYGKTLGGEHVAILVCSFP